MECTKNLLVACAHHLINIIVKINFRIKVERKAAIPASGGVLVVANHSSYLDIPILGHALFEKLDQINWIISTQNFRLWYLKWLFWIFRVIVVNGTIEKAKVELAHRRWVVIFPQGGKKWCPPGESRRRTPGKGAAVIALTTGATVLPVAILGTGKVLPARSFKFQPRHPITVRIGRPFSLPAVAEAQLTTTIVQETTDMIMDHIINLMKNGIN